MSYFRNASGLLRYVLFAVCACGILSASPGAGEPPGRGRQQSGRGPRGPSLSLDLPAPAPQTTAEERARGDLGRDTTETRGGGLPPPSSTFTTFEISIIDESLQTVPKLHVSSLTAHEIYWETKEAFGNFHFDTKSKCKWTAPAQFSVLEKSPTRIKLTAVLELCERFPHHFYNALPVNLTFALEAAVPETVLAVGAGARKKTEAVRSSSSLFPSLTTDVEVGLEPTSVVPSIQWKSQGTTRYMIESSLRAVEVSLQYQVQRWQKATNQTVGGADGPGLPSSDEHILGLGPQYSYTNMENRGKVPLWSGEQGRKVPLGRRFFEGSFQSGAIARSGGYVCTEGRGGRIQVLLCDELKNDSSPVV